jgi:hypothetical protein
MLSQISLKLIALSGIFCISHITDVNTQCATYIQIVPLGFEGCSLPQIVETHEYLTPCSAPLEFYQLHEGDYAYIDYVASGCANICQVGNEVDITCISFPVGIGDLNVGDEIKIFPTLAQDRICLQGNDVIQIEIYNDRGVRMMNITEPEVLIIDVAGMGPGIYFLKISTKYQQQVKKIVKL